MPDPQWLLDAYANGLIVRDSAVIPVPVEDEAEQRQSERAFMADVLKLAKRNGWRAYHIFDSRRSAEGFLDIELIRGRRLIKIETKSATGKTTPAQEEWIAAYREAGVEVYVFRPKDWREIERILS